MAEMKKHIDEIYITESFCYNFRNTHLLLDEIAVRCIRWLALQSEGKRVVLR